jgi:hypothetical protein
MGHFERGAYGPSTKDFKTFAKAWIHKESLEEMARERRKSRKGCDESY